MKSPPACRPFDCQTKGVTRRQTAKGAASRGRQVQTNRRRCQQLRGNREQGGTGGEGRWGPTPWGRGEIPNKGFFLVVL